MTRGRHLALGMLVSMMAVVFLDVALSLTLIRHGNLGHWVLPPYGAMHHPQHSEWLEHQKAMRDTDDTAFGTARFDPELGWRYVANSESGPEREGHSTYNSIGARSQREYTVTPAPDVVRLASFGESFTHSSDVDDEDTWARQLEVARPWVEALNFGVGGYGTDQALLRFRREGLHGAHAAVIGLMPENIGRNVNRYRPLWYPATSGCVAKPRIDLDETGALRVVPLPYPDVAALVAAVESGDIIDDLAAHEYWHAETELGWIRPSSLARMLAGWWAYRRRDVPRLYADRTGEPYRVTRAILEAFTAEAHAAGAKRTAVLILPRKPDLEQYRPGWVPYWSALSAELTAKGVDVIDAFPAFVRAAYPGDGTSRVAALFGTSHYSREGNAIIAAELGAWLEKSFSERLAD